MNHLVIIFVAALSLLCFSCRQNAAKQDAFDEQIAFIENNPQLYLSKIDTTRYKEIRNAETATEFLLAYLTRNYIDVTCYPPKPLLLESIRIFRKNHLNQQQLEALFLLAGIYRRENDLTNELQTIEQSIGIANREDDKEWLFHLYSYLGDMYLRKYNTMKYVRYQTIANQCIKDIPYEEMSLSTRVQVAKSLLYIDHHEKAYRLLQAIENNISESNIYYPQVYCLQGIALYKMEQWSPCIEKIEKILPLIQTNEQKFVCHSILTYCYYHINDTVNAGKHKGLAMSYDRNVYALPGRIDDDRSRGCNWLIRSRSAEPVFSLEDLAAGMGLRMGEGVRRKIPEDYVREVFAGRLDSRKIGDLAAVISAVRRNRGITVDELAVMLGRPWKETREYVAMLEQDGMLAVDIMQRCSICVGRQ